MDRLDAMTSFVRAVESGSFVAAARSLGLSAPMIGNHVRFLEARLGGSLLVRTTRTQSLTDLGRAYYTRCRTILADLEEAEALSGDNAIVPRGLLRISAPHSIGTTVLPAMIGRYLDRFPDMTVDLRLNDHRVDLIAEGFDVAIRGGALPDSRLRMRRLTPLTLVICAAPDYLRRHGIPARLEDLKAHECLDFAASSTPGRWQFGDAEKTTDVRVIGRLRSNSGHALRLAALEGRGIIMQPEFLVRDDLAAGRLVAVLPEAKSRERPMQLVMAADAAPPPKLRHFVNHIVGEFKQAREIVKSGTVTL
ncbi:LysR family transcriptional regulator [Gluconacetobacter sacchari DSM 12717]|nr:LysR family transcriptional regulator [Gluconacetobacter sacchari]GBQ26049.1 LysR family transcriptional regulator [Gluconacetobacter sacchari DSM 12717]